MSLNDERAASGRDVFATLTAADFNRPPEEIGEDRETAFFDMLVDLRHYAARAGLDFDSLLDRSAEFYALSLRAPDGAVSDLHD